MNEIFITDDTVGNGVWHTVPAIEDSVALQDFSDELAVAPLLDAKKGPPTYRSQAFNPEQRYAEDRRYLLLLVAVLVGAYILTSAWVIYSQPQQAAENLSRMHSIANAGLIAALAYFFSMKR